MHSQKPRGNTDENYINNRLRGVVGVVFHLWFGTRGGSGLGLEGARLQNQKIYLIDRLTGLAVEQITNHDYFRLFLGPRFGP